MVRRSRQRRAACSCWYSCRYSTIWQYAPLTGAIGRDPINIPITGACSGCSTSPFLPELKTPDRFSERPPRGGLSVSDAHVRFGSLADMCSAKGNVRFAPESGDSSARAVCPLNANSGRLVTRMRTTVAINRFVFYFALPSTANLHVLRPPSYSHSGPSAVAGVSAVITPREQLACM